MTAAIKFLANVRVTLIIVRGFIVLSGREHCQTYYRFAICRHKRPISVYSFKGFCFPGFRDFLFGEGLYEKVVVGSLGGCHRFCCVRR